MAFFTRSNICIYITYLHLQMDLSDLTMLQPLLNNITFTVPPSNNNSLIEVFFIHSVFFNFYEMSSFDLS